ncbi:hypothetical protein P280DRAFT_512784 [Massarina eburnea CBS 473.64]|uniref:Uncharacterized protein n=1 Tax=Massarina eburnea CBS 473.64 TaxID=1395130 RepID=A0A6A6SGF3_9PLEO|nr:hypothetical protein P280DRAFT_512784 [Massarina eburnea CBS 473.64]
MPRPNRYHPYSRNGQSSSPRTPPSLAQVLHPMPAFDEQPFTQPYQYIPAGYIKGVTHDGKALVPTSAYLASNGKWHVEMEVVHWPSEDIKQHSGAQLSAIPSPPMMQQTGTMFSGLGISHKQTQRKGSDSEASQGGRSTRGFSEECANCTDDEDAEGDVDDDDATRHMQAVLQQRRIIDSIAQRNAIGLQSVGGKW